MSVLRPIGVNVCRLLLAATFILSGFIKAIDPLGTQYKLHDYLTARSLDTLVPSWATLVAAVILAAVEFALGMYMLFAIERRRTTRMVLVLMACLTALTVWIAAADPVEDC